MRGNPFQDLIPQQQAPAQAGGANPFMDLIPGQQVAQPQSQVASTPAPTPELPTYAKIAMTGLGLKEGVKEGLKNDYRGLKQLALQAAEKVGLAHEGATADYTKQTDAARQEFNNSYISQAAPNATGIGQFAGSAAPYMLAPGGPVVSGAITGATQYVPEGGSRALNTLLGGLVGKAGDLAAQGGAKVYNAIKGNIANPAAKEIIDLGTQHNVPVFASDASKNPLLKGIAQGLEDVPIIGIKGDRFDQMQAAQTAAENLTDKLKQEMLNSNLDVNGLQKLTSDPIRGKAAQNLLNDVAASGDDWNKIIETSGNLKVFRNKLIADKKFNYVEQLASRYGNVDKENSLKAVDEALQAAMNPKNVDPNPALINKLQTLKDRLSSQDYNYNEIRQVRSAVGSMTKDYYNGKNAIIGADGAQYLQSIKNNIEKDMNIFAKNNGPELKKAWQDADSYYRNNVVPFKDPQLAKAFTNASPDEIYGKFITTGGSEGNKGTSRALRFYNALDDKGQAAVRYGMVNNAFEKAINRDAGTFSPAVFASNLDRVAAAKGVFFKGEAKAEIDGFKNLMRHVERSKIAMNMPETGKKLVPWVVGLGGYSAHALGASLGTIGEGAAAVYGLKKILTTRAGRNFLLASSKIKTGSPAMQKQLERFEKLMQRSAVVGATSPSDNGGDNNVR